jgi:hypothetical protein
MDYALELLRYLRGPDKPEQIDRGLKETRIDVSGYSIRGRDSVRRLIVLGLHKKLANEYRVPFKRTLMASVDGNELVFKYR